MKPHEILGVSPRASKAEITAAYRTLAEHAAAGRIKVEYENLPLEAAPDAWARQKSSPHRKLVLSPRS